MQTSFLSTPKTPNTEAKVSLAKSRHTPYLWQSPRQPSGAKFRAWCSLMLSPFMVIDFNICFIESDTGVQKLDNIATKINPYFTYTRLISAYTNE